MIENNLERMGNVYIQQEESSVIQRFSQQLTSVTFFQLIDQQHKDTNSLMNHISDNNKQNKYILKRLIQTRRSMMHLLHSLLRMSFIKRKTNSSLIRHPYFSCIRYIL